MLHSLRLSCLLMSAVMMVGCERPAAVPGDASAARSSRVPTVAAPARDTTPLPTSLELAAPVPVVASSLTASDEQFTAIAPEPPARPQEPRLIRLSPEDEVWIDVKEKQVIVGGYICCREGPLEMLVTLAQRKEHEAVVAANARAYQIHAALLAVGAQPGSPVTFRPNYQAAKGTQIDIEIEWTDKHDVAHQAAGGSWIRNARTQRTLDIPFVFGGSGFAVDPDTGRKMYLAEDGDVVCVSNFPTAMLDLPIESSQSANSLLFEAFTERIPPEKTKVKVFFKPRLPPKQGRQSPKQEARLEAGVDYVTAGNFHAGRSEGFLVGLGITPAAVRDSTARALPIVRP